MSHSDDEALTFIRGLLGSAARPDAPDPPDVEPDLDPSDLDLARALFHTKENQ